MCNYFTGFERTEVPYIQPTGDEKRRALLEEIKHLREQQDEKREPKEK